MFSPSSLFARWFIAIILAGLFTLGGFGYLDPIRQVLDSQSLTFKVGSFSLSLYKLLKGMVLLVVLFWIAGIVSASGERRLKKIRRIKASNRALLIKGFQSSVYFLMFLIGLDVLGIDLTALAVVGGAIGIGIGFGLQKITSNFISGLILLFEKSVEEGDLIELMDGISGFVRHTGARYTLVETFDSKEIMIPNEDFITSRVVNWTYSNNQGRIEIPIGVSYDSDIVKARELILNAATAHERCSKEPEAQCYLKEYADNSVNFILYMWVDDVTQGRLSVQNDVMFDIWQKFKENNISIPYPQRDIHIKNPEALR